MPDYTGGGLGGMTLQPYREPTQPDPFEGPSYDDAHPGWRKRAQWRIDHPNEIDEEERQKRIQAAYLKWAPGIVDPSHADAFAGFVKQEAKQNGVDLTDEEHGAIRDQIQRDAPEIIRQRESNPQWQIANALERRQEERQANRRENPLGYAFQQVGTDVVRHAVPYLRKLPGAIEDMDTAAATRKLRAGQGLNIYDADALARQQEEEYASANRSLGQNVAEASLDAPVTVAEWIGMGGAANAGRNLLQRGGTGLASRAAGLAGAAGARTLANPETAARTYAGIEGGQTPWGAFGRTARDEFIQNAVFEGLAPFEKQAGDAIWKRVAKGFAAGLTSNEAAADLKAFAGQDASKIGPVTALIAAEPGPERDRAWKNLTAQMVAMGGLEGVLNVRGAAADHVAELKRQGMGDQAAAELAMKRLQTDPRAWPTGAGPMSIADREALNTPPNSQSPPQRGLTVEEMKAKLAEQQQQPARAPKEYYGPGQEGDPFGPPNPYEPLPAARSLVPRPDYPLAPVRRGPSINTPGPRPAEPEPDIAGLLPFDPRLGGERPPEPDVRGIQPGGPPGGETDPRLLRAMQRRRMGLNLPDVAPSPTTPPEQSQGPSQANPWGTYEPPLPPQRAAPAAHPLVKAGVFATPEEAASFDRQAQPLIDRLNGKSWSKGLNQLVDSYDFDNDAEREAMQHYLGALAEGATVPNGRLKEAEAQAQQDLAQEVQKAGVNGAQLKEKLDAISPTQPRTGQPGRSDEASLERPGRTGTSTSSGVNKTAPTPRSNGTNRPMGRSLSNRIGDALTHEEVGTESEIVQHLKEKARAAGRPFGPQEMKAVLAELDAMVQRGDLERHQSRKTADNPDPEPIYVPRENLEGEKGEPLSPADIEKAKQALYEQTRLAQKAFEQSKNGPAATLRGQAGGNELTGDLGKDLARLGRVDTKELDPLANSGALGKHGIWNEHFRRLAVALKEWESGPKSLFARRIAEGRIGQVEDALPKVVAALREAGNDKAADFYERNIPAAAEALRQRINPSGPSGNDLTDYQRGAAREIAPEAKRRHEADITEYKRQTSLVREVLMRLRKFGFKEANPLAGPGNLQKKYGTQDANAIPGLDDLAKSYADNEPEKFGRDPQEAEEKIFNLLVGEQPEKPSADSYARHFENVKAERAEAMRSRYEARPAEAADFEPKGDANEEGLRDPGASEVEEGVSFLRTPNGRAPRAPGGTPGPAAQAVVSPPIPLARQAEVGTGILRHRNAERVGRADRDAKALDAGEKFFQVHTEAAPVEKNLPVADQTRSKRFLEFMDASESGNNSSLPTDQRSFADTYRRLKDQYTNAMVNLGILDNQSLIEDHVMHQWTDPKNPNATGAELLRTILGRRPLAGKEGFKKQRSIPTYREGIEAGLEPKSWNPMTLAKMEFDQYSKSIFGHTAFNELKDQGLNKYVPLGGAAPAGWQTVKDKLWQVFAPPETKVKEFFDKPMMDKLESFARGIGVKLNRSMTGHPGMHVPGYPGAPRGVSGSQPPGEITTRFGTPEVVLAHEIGHELDKQYPQLRQSLNNPSMQAELESLARLRASGQTSAAYQRYLQSAPERIANLVAGRVHAPELLQTVAPQSAAVLENLLQSTPRLQDLLSAKPSLELGQREQAMRLAGPMLTGNYYMPEAVARMVENHISPGLSSQPGLAGAAFRTFRGVGQGMSQFLLGLSGYHATATALNAQFSQMAEAMGMLSRGNRPSLGTTIKAVVPFAAAIDAVRQGRLIRAEWDNPGSQSPEVQQHVQWLKEMGGRARGGNDYMGTQLDQFGKAIRQIRAGQAGQVPAALLHALPAINQYLSKPVMDHLVPLIKMGVAMDAMKYEMSKNPTMDLNQRREVGRKIWDAMDDRFGQLTYDNLFINRALRDTLQSAFLSFGWNLGDVRGLGGGAVDAVRPSQLQALGRGEGISRRTGFLVAMMMGTAVYGSLYQLLATGKKPESPKDLWFPQDGTVNNDGTAGRKSLPGYSKDLASVFDQMGKGPLQVPRNLYHMGKGKISPLLNLLGELLDNQDWKQTAIDNPADPWNRQAKDDGMHILRALVPISVSSAAEQHKKGASIPRQLQGFAGITPAPYRITHSDQELLEAEQRRRFVPSPLEKKRREDASRGLNVPRR